MFRGKKIFKQNRIISISSRVIEFWCFRLPAAVRGGGVDGGQRGGWGVGGWGGGWLGSAPHTHAHAHMHMHVW